LTSSYHDGFCPTCANPTKYVEKAARLTKVVWLVWPGNELHLRTPARWRYRRTGREQPEALRSGLDRAGDAAKPRFIPRNTVVKPFGIYLQSRGLVPFDDASLHNALLADIAERHSSSGGLTDVDALRAGEDPNGAQGSNLVPAFGCSSARSSVDLLPLYALGAWLLVRRRGSNLRNR